MIDIINWQDILNDCKYDNSVGIKIAKIAGDEIFSTFITEIDVGKGVNPHFHKSGDEHYHIISGQGEVYLKNMQTKEEIRLNVNSGQSFVVPENVLHQLINTGNIPLILMFSCPTSHLETDRYF